MKELPSKSQLFSHQEKIVREGDVVHIYKPEATYTIIYGVHTIKQDPNQLPEHFDGLFLELISDYTQDPTQLIKWASTSTQYENVLRSIEEKQIPVYLADAGLKGGLSIPAAEILYPYLEAAAGVGLAVMALSEKLTKRRLLQIASFGGVAWLLTPFLGGTLAAANHFNAINADQSPSYREAYERNPDSTREFRRTLRKIHPEIGIFSSRLRASLIAHKEEWLAREMGNIPHFVTIMGKEHFGLEDQILNPVEQRLAFLQMMEPTIPVVLHPQTFYKMERFDFSDGQWQWTKELEIPELKAILSEHV